MFSDLNGIKIRSLESAIFKIGSLAGTKVINRLWQSFSLMPIWVPLGWKNFMIKRLPWSLCHLQDLIFKNGEGRQESREGWDELPLMAKSKELIESPYELVYSHNTVSPWEVQTGSRCVMLQSDLPAEVYKNFVMNDLEDLTCLRLCALEKHWSP